MLMALFNKNKSKEEIKQKTNVAEQVSEQKVEVFNKQSSVLVENPCPKCHNECTKDNETDSVICWKCNCGYEFTSPKRFI